MTDRICHTGSPLPSPTVKPFVDYVQKFAGVILGTAVGDALGLPREGLSRRRALKIFGPPPLQHRFFFRRGLCSDDTEHTVMVAQALLQADGDPLVFAECLAERLRWWIVKLPAGVGWATLRATLKLWIGEAPQHSGVFSAGNGPAMRSAIIGVYAAQNTQLLKALVHVSTQMTHTDPKAEQGALAVALAAQQAALKGPAITTADVFATLQQELSDPEFLKMLDSVREAVEAKQTPHEFATRMGFEAGVSGYVYHTVPAALFCWLRSPNDFREVVQETIALGGDADTTGAIAGALAGATVGASAIPAEWLDGLIEWPHGKRWMETLAHHLDCHVRRCESTARLSTTFTVPCLLFRNLVFIVLVLCHGVRRMLPPY